MSQNCTYKKNLNAKFHIIFYHNKKNQIQKNIYLEIIRKLFNIEGIWGTVIFFFQKKQNEKGKKKNQEPKLSLGILESDQKRKI